jgi:hypothetical protein
METRERVPEPQRGLDGEIGLNQIVQFEGVFVRVSKGTTKEVRREIMAGMIAATGCNWVHVQVR